MYKFNGTKLRELREKKGWTLRAAAAQLVGLGYENTTYQTWSNWEDGSNQPISGAAAGLAKLFNVKMEDLFK